MPINFGQVFVLGAATIASFASAVMGEPPAVFAQKTFDEAKTASVEAKKLLIVDATAEWCGPCKRMDATTWVDQSVIDWIGTNAIAIQIDVDAQKTLAQDLTISAMPTIIVFKEGQEFDRVVGYRDSADLLTWLTQVQQGKREIDKLKEAAGSRADASGKVDIRARLDLAQALERSGKLDEATDEFVWLWDNMLKFDPAFVGVRGSFMVGDMQRLASRHAPAKARFAKLRDALEEPLKAGKANRNTLHDWISLNEVVNEEQRTLDWIDRIIDKPEAGKTLRMVDYKIEDLLATHGRWTVLGRLYDDPVAKMRRDIAMDGMLPQEEAESFKDYRIQKIATLYAACLAAQREQPALDLAALALELRDKPATHFLLINVALRAQQGREHQLQWLVEAAKAGDAREDLREEVKTLLK